MARRKKKSPLRDALWKAWSVAWPVITTAVVKATVDGIFAMHDVVQHVPQVILT